MLPLMSKTFKVMTMSMRFLLIFLLFGCPILLWSQRGYYASPVIRFKQSTYHIKLGQSDTIPHKAKAIEPNKPVLWRSLMPSIASVDARGVVTGKRYGRTQIVAYTADNKAADTCTIMVSKNRTFTANGVSFDMIYVQGGTFWMGAQEEDKNSPNYDYRIKNKTSSPVHQVTLSDYFIGETEVTQALWEAVMGYNPTVCGYRWNDEIGIDPELPVYYVSWNDCQAFIDKLNMLLVKQLKGYVFAFPTEAQWEFAARGGIYATMKNGQYCFSYAGSDKYYHVTELGELKPVKSKRPNELGIYDMTGNVEEWCADRFYAHSTSDDEYLAYPTEHLIDPYLVDDGPDRVYRGGSFRGTDYHFELTVFIRDTYSCTIREEDRGLRLVLYKKNQKWLKGYKSQKPKPEFYIM